MAGRAGKGKSAHREGEQSHRTALAWAALAASLLAFLIAATLFANESAGAERHERRAGLSNAVAVSPEPAARGESEEGNQSSAELPKWLIDALGAPAGLSTRLDPADAGGSTPVEGQEPPRAFPDLSQAESVSVVTEKFPTLVNVPFDPAPPLQEGERITGYPTPYAATLESADGKTAVAESLLPLLAPDANGEQAPVDLSLRESDKGLEPGNPIVPVLIGRQLTEGFRIPSLGLTLTPVDPSGEPLQGSAAIAGAVAHYGNTQVDTDTLVKPAPAGFQTHSILRSPASPEQLHFSIGIEGDEDPTLTSLKDGSILIEASGKQVTTIPPAIASDAAGSPVPVAMEVEGNRIVLSLDHRSGQFQYPIDVDPTAADWNAFSSTAGNWIYTTNVPGQILGTLDTTWSDALEINNHFNYPSPSNWLNYGDYGAWSYQTQGVSRIYQLDANVGTRNTNGTFVAIAGSGGNEAIQWLSPLFGYPYETSHTICAKSGCSSTGGSSSNAAVFELIATASGTEYIYSGLTGATVRIVQDQPAAITFNTTDPTIGSKPNALYQGGSWIKSSQNAWVGVSANDPGLGLSYATLTSPGYGSWNGNYFQSLPGCVGVQCDPGWSLNRAVGNLPEGERKINAYVSNAAINSEATKYVKIDNSGPIATLSGLGSSYIAGLGESEITIEVTDGNQWTASSGVGASQTSVSLDGEEILAAGGEGCSPGPCTIERELSFVGRDIGVGQHTLAVTAVDQIGNKATTEFPFVVVGNIGPTIDMGPGQLDIRSGDFFLTQTDIAEDAAGATLSLTRSHESLRRTGEESPLGPGWQLSFGAWRSLRKMADGTAVISDSMGRQVVFDEINNGYFHPALDYPGWTLRYFAEEQAYKLTAPGGGATSFKRPSGAPAPLYMPSASIRPDGTQSTSFSFEYVSGAIRPKYVIAPLPEGVEFSEPGSRYLSFSYDSATTASGGAPDEWGDYKGRLSSVSLVAWDPESEAMVAPPVVEYSYDASGRLRAAWDPRISPALKTTYGYDDAGHVTALTPPGQQPWVMKYGTVPGSPYSDWLLAASRTGAAEAFGNGEPPENTEPPHFSSTPPVAGRGQHVWNGAWSNDPLGYSYQWSRCDWSGKDCAQIPGATDQSYRPKASDIGHRLLAAVTAANGGGSSTALSAASMLVMKSEIGGATYQSTFGNQGSGNGQFKLPTDVAIDPTNDTIWVADSGNSRIQHFDAAGKYLGQFSSPSPAAVEIDPQGNLYVASSGTVRKLTPAGTLIKQIAGFGTGDGQVRMPTDLALDAEGNLWVADYESTRVQKFNDKGEFAKSISLGHLGKPWGIDVAPNGDIWVAEPWFYRVSVYNQQGERRFRFGSQGSGHGQFGLPADVEVDAAGNAWVGDDVNDRVQVFNEAGEYLSQFGESGSGEGQLEAGWWLRVALGEDGDIWLTDAGNHRVQRWQVPEAPEGEAPPPPEPTTAVWTAIYDVPLSGSSVPSMTAASVGQWGQSAAPVDATAIFPPDQIPSRQPTDYERATIYYLDTKGQIVNTRSPGDRISTEERGQYGNVTRTLTPENRARSLAAGASSQTTSEQLDTRLTYSEDGSKLLSVLGPTRKVKLESGSEVEARLSTKYFYDEGAPEGGGPYNLATKQTEGALVGEVEHDVRTKSLAYGGQGGLGWELRKPTSETVDPGGLNLTTTTLYDADTGGVIETRMPANPAGGDAHATQTIHYTAGTNEVAACGDHPEWAGLVCQVRPAAQPETLGLPDLPVTTTTYNLYNQPLVTTEVVGEATREATITYDDAGRALSVAISSTSGKALPDVHTVYDEETGLPTVVHTEAEMLVSQYDSLGRRISYTDADSNTSTYEYDFLGRVTEVFDGKGLQTFSYDAVTGDLAKVEDSAVGTMTAEYDSGGKMTSMAYPNGLEARYSYDAGGFTTALEYVKTTDCSEECVWFEDEVMPSADGKVLSQLNTITSVDYAYDDAGRLTRVEEAPQGEGCTTRLYAYDANTNRTSATTREPTEGGDCAESGGEITTNAFDEADRLIGEGVAYDDFGNITVLPAAYAGGKALSSTFYADNSTSSLTQGATTIKHILDPAGRDRETITIDGEGESERVAHFAGDGDSPAWTIDDSGSWTRYVSGIGGLAAIQSSTEGIELQLPDLHGNIVATAPADEEVGLTFLTQSTEYGVPKGGAPAQYGWLGSAQRPTELESGVMSMGARTYVPQLGRFLQTDPVSGGSANSYSYVFGDPVGESDLSGEYTPGAAPSWLLEFMESPPGMPPPPISPTVEAEFLEEEIWGVGGMELQVGLGDVVDVIVDAAKAVARAVESAWNSVKNFVADRARDVAGKVGRNAAAVYRVAVRFAVSAANGGKATLKGLTNYIKREFNTHIPQLVACGKGAYDAFLAARGVDPKKAAVAAAAGCVAGWRGSYR
jgi:RHS repeat-associated protein